MRLRLFLLYAAVCLSLAIPATAAAHPDWTAPVAPFRIADNLYYVGSRDLASYLVTTPAGNILINANLAGSPPLIRASIERLGFRYPDTRILLNGQAHFDHMAGAAEILRETHARDMVMEYDAALVRDGGASDFARRSDDLPTYAPARVDRVLHDGDTVALGGVTLTAHRTAGHTRGCTTWTFRTHVPGEPASRLRDVVILGGFTALGGYRLIDTPGRPASYPGIAQDFARTFATLRTLPCDIFLGAHGVYFDMLAKRSRLAQQGPAVFIDPAGYRRTVDEADAAFEAKLKAQQAGRANPS